jgi:5-methylcytosine-specific restriction protein B
MEEVIGKMKTEFEWVDFYSELANKILTFKNNRSELLSKVYPIFERVHMNNYFKEDGINLTDLSPFSVIGIFNRGIKTSNRIATLMEFAKVFNITAPIPESFDGIPVLHNVNAWFFGGKNYDRDTHIDKLWELFDAGITLADAPNNDAESRFVQAFDFVITQPGSSWNITFGLFWIRPNCYMTLDENTRTYLNNNFGKDFDFSKLPDGKQYLEICHKIKNKLSESDEVGSFPALSRAARKAKGGEQNLQDESVDEKPVNNQTGYNKLSFLNEVYMKPEKYGDIYALLDRKKNIILQGAPGVGKSFMARRLAYSVIGMKDASKVEMIQFHQSYSYEDFIEGFRPVESGKFEVKRGVFYNFCKKAGKDKANKYFFIIDEINRGNFSKIMGELMLLLENDKRGEEFAIPLTYSGERFFVPENIYIIGMMNTADRSLARIDYALRRRFSFITIEPAFDNERFIADFKKNYSDADTVIDKMKKLNTLIASELDSNHQIGHSYFCFDKSVDKKVISDILCYEIKELLSEYFFDNEEKLNNALGLL